MITMSNSNTEADDFEGYFDFDIQTMSEEEEEVDYDLHQIISGRSPCDGCMNINSCRSDDLACRDFLFFVDEGKVRNLDRKALRRIYIKIYCNENGDNLNEETIQEIKFLNSIRGMTHSMIADKFYIVPLRVRQIIESK